MRKPFRPATRLICCLVSTALVVCLVGCLAQPTHTNVPLRDLIVDLKSALPGRPDLAVYVPDPAYTKPESESDGNLGIENKGVIYKLDITSLTGGALVHWVYRSSNPYRASVTFNYMLETKTVRTYNGPPKWWTYRSPIADDWQGGCDEEGPAILCTSITRYDEFISVVNYNFLPSQFTGDEWQRVLKSIDEQFAKHLGKTMTK